jgi:hypothetical protein
LLVASRQGCELCSIRSSKLISMLLGNGWSLRFRFRHGGCLAWVGIFLLCLRFESSRKERCCYSCEGIVTNHQEGINNGREVKKKKERSLWFLCCWYIRNTKRRWNGTRTKGSGRTRSEEKHDACKISAARRHRSGVPMSSLSTGPAQPQSAVQIAKRPGWRIQAQKSIPGSQQTRLVSPTLAHRYSMITPDSP